MLGYLKTIPAFLKNFYQFFEKIKKFQVKILSTKRFGIFDTQNVWSNVSFLVCSLLGYWVSSKLFIDFRYDFHENSWNFPWIFMNFYMIFMKFYIDFHQNSSNHRNMFEIVPGIPIIILNNPHPL
jgi:hypothetical protein